MMAVRFLRRTPRPVAKRQAVRGRGELSAAAGVADVSMSAVEVASGERCVLTENSGDAAQSADAACTRKSIVGAGRRL